MPTSPDSNFIARFEQAMVGTDDRLRHLESGQAALKQEMKSLKEDRCANHDRAIKELFDSRNALEKTVELLKRSESGISAICENLDRTVEKLDRQSLLLGKGEESVSGRLETISKWEVPARLQQLETKVGSLEQDKAAVSKKTTDYRMLVYGALFGAVCSGASGYIIWLLTHP